MDIYETTTCLLLNTTLVHCWSDVGVLIERNAFGRPRDWQLPILACEAVGGDPQQAVPAAAAIACSQISIILIDDYKQAQSLLAILPIAHPEKLAGLLEPLIEPVQALFAEAGLPQPAV